MPYRDDREALRAKVDALQQELTQVKAAAEEIVLFPNVVVFDDMVGASGEVARASVISGMRLVAAGRSAVLFLATSGSVRAIRIGEGGTFAPAKIDR